MVRLARIWHNVPKQKRCRASYPNPYKYILYLYLHKCCLLLLRNASRIIPRGNRLHLQLYTDGCSEKRESQVKYIEHVQAIGKVTRVGCIVIKKFLYLKVSLNAPKRGFCFHQNKVTIALEF